VTISFDPSLLVSWYSAREGVPVPGTSTGTTASNSTAATAPTPPWQTASATTTSTSQSADQKAAAAVAQATTAANNILNGQPLINAGNTQLSVNGTNAEANSDYKNLFALYQGVTALQGIATQASTASAAQLATYQKAFSQGLGQVQSFLSTSPFSQFSLALGGVTATDTSTAVTPTETDTYQGPAIYTGDLSVPPPSLSGNVAFSANVKLANGSTKTVNFDLSEMGSTPRTLPNVVTYLNSKLQAAGLSTTFQDVRIPGVATTVGTGANAYTLPAGADSFALKLVGTPEETVTFSATDTQPAVYVSQTSGSTVPTETYTPTGVTTTPAVNSQLLTGLTADPSAAAGTPDKLFGQTLGSNTTGATYQATGPDGSLYVVSTDSGTGPTGQALPGPQNVVLTKYDSTGQVVYTRTLGTAGSATAYSVAVSPDGKSVAVAGSITGALNASDGSVTSGQSDTFVAEYDASSGDTNWVTRAGTSAGDDTPTGVTFDANGSVYVSGQTSAAFSGQSLNGAQDGFVQSFSSKGVAGAVQEFGTSGVNSTAGVTVSGSNLVVAGVEGGHAVLRTFAISGTDTLTAGAVRDLGSLNGGNVAGISTAADGSVVVAGSTHNGALAAGTVTTAYSGGKEAFVAKLSATGTASASDSLAYYSAGGDTTTTAVTTANGVVYIAGQVAGPADAASDGLPSNEGFVTAIDPTTGQATWTNSLTGDDGQNRPNSIAVSATGSSALNLLGLPAQTIQYAPSPYLVDNSALQAGDKFSITLANGTTNTITIDPQETLQTLAAKINTASQNQLTASVGIATNGSDLTIKPSNSRQTVTLNAGPADADALSALGIAPGEVAASASTYATVSSTSNLKVSPYALGLTGNLSLDSTADITSAQTELTAAQGVLKAIFTDMTTKPLPKTASSGTGGTVPAYLTAQIADYQTALARLQSAESTPSTTLSLFG